MRKLKKYKNSSKLHNNKFKTKVINETYIHYIKLYIYKIYNIYKNQDIERNKIILEGFNLFFSIYLNLAGTSITFPYMNANMCVYTYMYM